MVRVPRFFIYACVGAVGTAVQYAFLVGAVSTHSLAPVPATTIGSILGALVNYVLNARLTFRVRQGTNSAMRFAAISLVGIVVNALLMKLLNGVLGWNYLFSQVLATLAILLLTYTLNRLWTFRHDKPA